MWDIKSKKTGEVVFVYHSNLIVRQYLRSLLEEAGHTVHIFEFRSKMSKKLERKYKANTIWNAHTTDRTYRLSLCIKETNLKTKRSKNIYHDPPLLGKNLALEIKSPLMKKSRNKLKVLVSCSTTTVLWHLLALIDAKGHTREAYDDPDQITPGEIQKEKPDLIWRAVVYDLGHKKRVLIKEENVETGKIEEILYDLRIGPGISTNLNSPLLNKK